METGQEELIYWGIILGMIAFSLLAGGVVYFNIRYQKKMFVKQQEIHHRESAYKIQLLKTVIDVSENERHRIASDLHDEIGSHLSSVRMAFNAIIKNSESDIRLIQMAGEGKAIIDETIESVRTIAYNLMPPGLEKFGFVNTADDLCHKISQHSNLQIEFNCDPALHFSPTTSLALYRILQELLNNTIKYGAASDVKIGVRQKGSFLFFTYSDNGRGFNIDTNVKNGLGLKNIESRVLALQGTYSIITAPQHGFQIEIQISGS